MEEGIGSENVPDRPADWQAPCDEMEDASQPRSENPSGTPGEVPSEALPVRLDLKPEDAAALKRILSSLSNETADEPSPDTAKRARWVAEMMFEARKARARLFPAAMFNEPAWDMLLSLYLTDGAPAAADLARWTDTPLTTAMRWIVYLEGHRLISRETCATDRRAQTVHLTEQARAGLQALLSEVAQKLP